MPSSQAKSQDEKREELVEKMQVQHTTKLLIESLQATQKENELLKIQLRKSARVPSGRIGFLFLTIGTLALAGSIATTSTILAFIGLGLTFWGALFFFVRPIKFVRGTLLDSTAISTYVTIDRIIDDLGYKGKVVYIPPYPRDVYLPEYLKGLKEMVVLISADETIALPAIEEMAKKQFLLENPKGICITPPGLGVMSLLEKELKTDFTKIDLKSLPDILPKLIIRDLELAGGIETDDEGDLIHVKIDDSIYKDLYSPAHELKSIHLLGDPLASAIACILSKATAKPINIVNIEIPHRNTIELWYKTLES
ncbi:MAG: hypothetical protein JSV51_02940 [Candidatus Bathyarchaeota archaeon]|nr:MAG: hypothetical protein JSV51_02940 [Candidatus Bathyarchaeota archaeon]